MRERAAAVVTGAVLLLAAPAFANKASEALRARASSEFYNLDRDEAAATYREAIAADPEDAAAYRGLASSLWLSITFRRGNMTVDDYLGGATRQKINFPPPPAETAAAFATTLEKALAISRNRLRLNPQDIDAQYELGTAIGLRASYLATVDGSMLGAFRAARDAYDAHEMVLKTNPARKDAGLIVGTYRYVVAALALPLRLVAYMAGFGGDKDKGVQMVEGAASYPGSNQTDARVALLLLYNREHRYDDALRQAEELRARYPRNRLFLLEEGSTSLRAGKTGDAERLLSEGITRLATDNRPRMFGEVALWYYKRGAARAALGRVMEARTDLAEAIGTEGRNWVHGRSHLELGKLALKAGDRATAGRELGMAISLCEGDNDAASAAQARLLLK